MSFSNSTGNVTTKQPDISEIQDEVKFLVVPLIVILLIMLLSALVYWMAIKRRRNNLRNNLLSLYEFDSNEQEWESLNSYDNPNYNTTNF